MNQKNQTSNAFFSKKMNGEPPVFFKIYTIGPSTKKTYPFFFENKNIFFQVGKNHGSVRVVF
jgi:hypothetical protein